MSLTEKEDLFSEIDKFQNKINALRPLPKVSLKQLRDYFKVGLTYASNALEGNSLTETETKIVLEDGLTIGGKPLRDCNEALGHGEAFDWMWEFAKKKESIGEEAVLKLHEFFYHRIDKNEAGKYRKVKVFISGSKATFPDPKDVPDRMKKFVKSLPALEKKIHPVEFSALVHKEFVFIHPFIDGNGRVARLLMNLALLQKSYVIAIIPPILRGEYIAKLEKAHVTDKDFVIFIGERIRETQKDYLRLIK